MGASLNLGVIVKKGGFKAFRGYLNERFKNTPKWKNRRWEQRVRGYGDYLYFQDREMFDEHITRALKDTTGEQFPGFDGQAYFGGLVDSPNKGA